MNKIINKLKELDYYWISIIGNTIMFQFIGIMRYYTGGYDWDFQFESHRVVDLWIWGTGVFFISLILGLIFIPKINRKMKEEAIANFKKKYENI